VLVNVSPKYTTSNKADIGVFLTNIYVVKKKYAKLLIMFVKNAPVLN